MQGIAVGELRLTGGLGIGKITKFSMREYPGEHARAELVGIAETRGSSTAELPRQIKNCSVELYAEGEERAIYSGIVQRAESQEENGYRLLRLELGSGSLLMDMEKEKRTFQDISMTYGQVITQIASEDGMMAVYPRLLDETAIGFPVIQYRETDWAFIRRLASRFGMAVYPETTLGGGKLTVDLPQTGNAGELSCLGYTARIDRKFYQAGGEQEGRSREQYQTYEVRSMGAAPCGRCGDVGRKAPVCLCKESRYLKTVCWSLSISSPAGSGRGRSVLEIRKYPGCRCLERWRAVPARRSGCCLILTGADRHSYPMHGHGFRRREI